jgi:hypothetical protein
LVGFLMPPAARAQARGPSTADERARAVKVAHELENAPLAADAVQQREWVMQWIMDVPDITVNVCLGFFGKLPVPPRGHSVEITRQMIISSAAFMIEHPDKAKNEQAVDLSGLLGALKAYQAILKREPESRWEYLDMLLQLNEEGALGSYVGEIRAKCNSEEKEKDPHSMRTQARNRANLYS